MPSRRSLSLPAVALLASFTLSGCATVVGTVAGPVTGPITAVKHTDGVPKWAWPLAIPAAVAIGPFLGMVQGISCDVGFLRNGEYGVDGHPPFGLIFDPASLEHSAHAHGNPPLFQGR